MSTVVAPLAWRCLRAFRSGSMSSLRVVMWLAGCSFLLFFEVFVEEVHGCGFGFFGDVAAE